ncbi:MAG: 3-dehydro-L-gulonate 2-dehydrogenase [Sphaerochaetaceae bacterium]|nr:3-dehydro-L-gulonate 2-dehydrogenase [Sphaerochaetaceae bacterium]MDC7236209.1 3-dehydro-L-gulonate 2-dehydrogenase [Sphaerochaetaceae bacterium]MDC7243761.1 3-dehydro-L-gulonate 2-dehydrogenase [Sphaerochaetaceae bacterium]
MRIQAKIMQDEFSRILLSRGYSLELATESAKNFVNNSLDGMYSHGVNRFPRVIEYIDKGYIKVDAKESVEQSIGAIEIWNGNLAMGNLVATHAMQRTIDLAKIHGIGAVAIKNTNHWMRGGAYGWQAANAGCASICWTNTMPNMPAWGSIEAIIGNNPFVLSIPRKNGKHVVVDMALSQFSYGKIEEYKLLNKELAVYGGFNKEGKLTKDPKEIEESLRPLPVGYWKGSALSVGLDIFASFISGGLSTPLIGQECESEYSLSQIMIAIDVKKLDSYNNSDDILEKTLELLKAAKKDKEDTEIRYPAEREYRTRVENLEKGIPVNEDIWDKIRKL